MTGPTLYYYLRGRAVASTESNTIVERARMNDTHAQATICPRCIPLIAYRGHYSSSLCHGPPRPRPRQFRRREQG